MSGECELGASPVIRLSPLLTFAVTDTPPLFGFPLLVAPLVLPDAVPLFPCVWV